MKNERIINYAQDHHALYVKTAENTFENVITETTVDERPVVRLVAGTEYFGKTSDTTSHYQDFEVTLKIFGDEPDTFRQHFASLGIAE